MDTSDTLNSFCVCLSVCLSDFEKSRYVGCQSFLHATPRNIVLLWSRMKKAYIHKSWLFTATDSMHVVVCITASFCEDISSGICVAKDARWAFACVLCTPLLRVTRCVLDTLMSLNSFCITASNSSMTLFFCYKIYVAAAFNVLFITWYHRIAQRSFVLLLFHLSLHPWVRFWKQLLGVSGFAGCFFMQRLFVAARADARNTRNIKWW